VDDNSDNSNQEHYGNHSDDDYCLSVDALVATFFICNSRTAAVPQVHTPHVAHRQEPIIMCFIAIQ